MEAITVRDVESYIEGKLSKIPVQKNKEQKKPDGGLETLLIPLKLEMMVARDIISLIRRGEMRKLLNDEFKHQNNELKAMGLALQPNELL